MDYMTLKEAAEKWGVTPRRVNYYCAGGRIPGAVKMAGVWLIPKNAEKPIDGRTKQGKGSQYFSSACSTHSASESVNFRSLSLLRLECHLHVTYTSSTIQTYILLNVMISLLQ